MCAGGYTIGNVKTKGAMKPRTKTERMLLELRKQLPQGMTEAQQRYADRLLAHNECAMVSVVTAMGEWTVIRSFMCRQGRQDEVYENWVNDNGREWILSRSYNRSPFYFSWNYESEWGINHHNEHCSGYYVMEDVYAVWRNYMYPRQKVSAKLKRNGWSGTVQKRVRLDPVNLMRALLTNNEAEWLVKVGQYDLLAYMSRYGSLAMHGYVKSAINICVRNGYYVRDAGMWLDYLDLLVYFGKDTHNAHYVCPQNLRKEHDRLVVKKRRIEEAKELAERVRQAAEHEEDYKRFRGMYFGICFGNDDIMVAVINSVVEMAEEGTVMHHCVFENEYWNEKRHPYSLILSARDSHGNRLETVEVSTETWEVMQSRGLQNNPTEHHDEIVALVKKNMNLLKTA